MTAHVSVGGAIAQTDDDLGTLIARADDAMYRSKQAGRDQVTVDDPPPEDPPAEEPAGPEDGVSTDR